MFVIGQRVQIHPATDAWVRGIRYGYVCRITKKKITVKSDAGPTVSFLRDSELIIAL